MNAEVLAVSMEDLSNADYAVRALGFPFPILYDLDADVVEAYGVYNLHGNNLPTPSTFIIDTEGNIRWEYIGRNARTDRAPNSEVIAQLRMLN